ncbi:hypothetical protein FB563_7044 [Streptomyces puniciscabiei]|uniref:Uncharacterized protein n=1 Tax=Streptomyces puniciscabiei TaxID=164348 RepID=A0A542TJI1_9ACTN|nr:hypothetical protein FB563_7044 [Streptomyces puniciscabiei]
MTTSTSSAAAPAFGFRVTGPGAAARHDRMASGIRRVRGTGPRVSELGGGDFFECGAAVCSQGADVAGEVGQGGGSVRDRRRAPRHGTAPSPSAAATQVESEMTAGFGEQVPTVEPAAAVHHGHSRGDVDGRQGDIDHGGDPARIAAAAARAYSRLGCSSGVLTSAVRPLVHRDDRAPGAGRPQCFLRRFDIERTFRLLKQTLGWTKPRLRSSEAADRWTWLVIAPYAQLRLARPLATDLRRPWEKPTESTSSRPPASAERSGTCTREDRLPGWCTETDLPRPRQAARLE